MYTQVNEQAFITAFNQVRPDNFTYEGLQSLFQYFEDLECDIGESMELDVIAICCDWSEADIDDVRADYGLDMIDYPYDDDVLKYLQDRTTVTSLDNGNFLYIQF